jgi:5'(3')-deoxyribonucleotidase
VNNIDKKKLILDADGCILNSIKAIVDLYNQDYQYYKEYRPISWLDIESWNFDECTLTSRQHIDDYFNNPRFFEVVEFMENAKEVITELSDTYEIVVCSR